MKRHYQRSKIYTFSDLTTEQQKQAVYLTDETEAENDTYVLWNNEPLPLGMFMHIKHPLFHGQYTLTAFSCYFIRLNNTGEQATVIYAYV